jgi:ADP-heptose:LPS heptosyltransferase
MVESKKTVLVHVASGVGNIVLATPLLVALGQMGHLVDLLLSADYPGTADLFRGWSVVRTVYEEAARAMEENKTGLIIPAIPPFYWARFKNLYPRGAAVVPRPPDSVFYQDEQEYYLGFARQIGFTGVPKPSYCLPISSSTSFGVTHNTLVLAPGSKTGEMAAKRWPYFSQVAEAFPDVAVVGTGDDLHGPDGKILGFPAHVRLFVDQLSLRETAELMASAGAVLGNDSGLSHIAAAVGTPTFMLFGPTPHTSLGPLAPNAKVHRAGLGCEPCWFTSRFQACAGRIHCLHEIRVDDVRKEIQGLAGLC